MSEQIVLGLRATPVQREWMNAKAAAMGISLQKYFEQVMQQQDESPWRTDGSVTVIVPKAVKPAVEMLCEIHGSAWPMWRFVESLIEKARQHMKDDFWRSQPPKAG